MDTVHMIGHSNQDWPTFLSLLTQHRITTLVDVRSSARSRFPQFNAARLQERLGSIVYVHRSQLGGRDPLPADQLKAELQVLLASPPAQGQLCLMCSEGDYHDCHRHHLLTPLVLELGWRVQQIQRDGTLVEDLGPSARISKRAKSGSPLLSTPHP